MKGFPYEKLNLTNKICLLENENYIHTWKNQRAYTTNEIVKFHNISINNIRSIFSEHKDELQEGIDYYNLTWEETQSYILQYSPLELQIFFNGRVYRGIRIFTPRGYLLLLTFFRSKNITDIRKLFVEKYLQELKAKETYVIRSMIDQF